MARKPFTDSVTGRVTQTYRHGHTVNGNPIMSVTLDNGQTYRISNDAGLVYGIANKEYATTLHTYDLTASGRMSGYVRTEPPFIFTPRA